MWGATAGRVARGTPDMLLAAVLLLASVNAILASHFRYGSITWYPGPKARTLNQFEAVFELQMVYRKDYNWGAYFKTQWRESAKLDWRKTTNGMPPAGFNCSDPGVYSGEVTCFQEDSSVDYTTGYQILLPVGMGALGRDLAPNNDGRDFYTLGGTKDNTADPENTGGRMCASPLHKGVKGSPDALTANIGQESDENFPQYESGDLVEDPDDPTHKISVCSPWSETNGFFFGDSLTSYHNPGVILNVRAIDHEGSMLGNYIRGSSEAISHIYPAQSNGGQPYVAYMTGGNRLSTLMNNPDGRFRLEIGVFFNMKTGADGRKLFLKNRSPIASTIPIMPVVYTDSFGADDGAKFQIAAIDPDFGDPDLGDQVRFFIGTLEEHGGILGNPVYVPLNDGSTVQVFTWYKDYYYSFICARGLAISSIKTSNPTDEICTSLTFVGRDNALKYSNPLDPYLPLDLPVDELYNKWDPEVNEPRPPKDLTIDVFSGFVTFQTGRDPWTDATNGVAAKAPGLYQLTVMIEERHADQIDPVTGWDVLSDGSTAFPQKDVGMKVPLDFLIYLYTPMHYCSKSCDNGAPTAGLQYPAILQTFESVTGYYGDEASTQFVRSDGLEGPGTGQCRLCGGGGSIVPFFGVGSKVEYYEESVRNAVQFCRIPEAMPYSTVEENLVRNGTIGTDGNTYGIVGGVNLDDAGLPFQWKSLADGTRPAWRYLPEPTSGLDTNYCENARTYTGPTDQTPALEWQGWVFQGCLGYRDNVTQTLIPYDGELDSCMINNQPEFITGCTLEHPSGDCAVLNQTAGQLLRTTPALGCGFRMQQGVITELDDTRACCGSYYPSYDPINTTTMNAEQGIYPGMYNPATIEAVKGETIEFDLVATDYDQCVELEILDTGLSNGMLISKHERLDTRTVARKFTWGPVDINGKSVTTAEEDMRETLSLVCFYAYDRYLATANPFHCVRISLAMPASIRWCDQPSGTVSPLPLTVDNSVLPAFLGEETCVDLCVAKRDEATTFVATNYNLAVRTVEQEVSGLYPMPSAFQYPYDQINFPPSGAFKAPSGTDPLTRQWCFEPTPTEECVYTVCFQGIDVDTVYADDHLDDKLETTNVRCVKIEVYNTVATFTGAEILEADELSSHVVPWSEEAHVMGATGGFTMSAWVWPDCAWTNVNQTIMYFGSTRSYGGTLGGGDNGLEVRNGLMFHHLNDTDREALGYFSYNDCKIGHVYSAQKYCCQCWHYVAVTISAEGEGTLYVDGTRNGHARQHTRDELMYDAVDFKTSSFPDNNADGDTTGIFSIGGSRTSSDFGYQGHIDEVRVWNRAMTNLEVLDTVYARVPNSTDITLKGHFHMRQAPDPTGLPVMMPSFPLADGSNTVSATGLVAVGGINPSFTSLPIPPMVPCVLGIQHSVGPVDGECLTDVYGWSMADSNNVVCQFGGQDSRGRYIDTNRVRCVTPGHMSPRFAEVKVSNDGYRFTDTVGAGKVVQHLFMESSLYTDGAGEGGVQADGVCLDLPTREMTFGGWFCPKCVIPEEMEAPPPPPPPPPAPEATATPTPTPTATPVVPGGR